MFGSKKQTIVNSFKPALDSVADPDFELQGRPGSVLLALPVLLSVFFLPEIGGPALDSPL